MSELSNVDRSIVESRLLSSKVLAQTIAELAMSLRKLVDPGSGEASALVTSSIEKSIGKDITSKTSSAIQPQASPEGETDENNEPTGPSSSEVEDADGWESGSVDDVPYDREAQNNEELSDEDAGSGDNVSNTSAQSSPLKPPKVSANVKSTSTASAAESKFLPSLSVGFTRGDSDSDWSDGEAGLADGPKKKNRRGQRARKAWVVVSFFYSLFSDFIRNLYSIWEKKYGRNANHLRKQREEMNYTKGKGPPPLSAKRAPESGSPRTRTMSSGSRRDQRPGSRIQSQQRRSGKPEIPVRPSSYPQTDRLGTSIANDKPLHPSWEAKRKLKQTRNDAIVPSQGKRLKFD